MWIVQVIFVGAEIRDKKPQCPSQELCSIPALRQYQVLVSHHHQTQGLASQTPSVSDNRKRDHYSVLYLIINMRYNTLGLLAASPLADGHIGREGIPCLPASGDYCISPGMDRSQQGVWSRAGENVVLSYYTRSIAPALVIYPNLPAVRKQTDYL